MATPLIFNNNGWNTPVRLWSITPWGTNSSSYVNTPQQSSSGVQPWVVWGYKAIAPNWTPPQIWLAVQQGQAVDNPYLAPWNTLPARQSLYNNSQQASQLWFPQLGNYFNQLVSDLSARDTQNKGLLDLYWAFGENMYRQMWDRNSLYWALNKDMLWRLSELMTQYQQAYWPQWSQTRRVNDLYGNYGNYLLNKNAQDRAIASWIANRYWLSDNARNIAQSDVGLQWLSEALKVFDAETQALDNINKTFNALTTDAFSKYKWIQDDYLKSLYDQNFWIQTQLSQWLLNMLANNEQLKNQYRIASQWQGQTAWGSQGSQSTQVQPKYLVIDSIEATPSTVVTVMDANNKTYALPRTEVERLLATWEAIQQYQ